MRFPKPWFRPSRGLWYVTFEGRQHNLGADRDAAFLHYKELITRPKEVVTCGDSLLVLFDAFLEWTNKNRALGTYDWYHDRLKWFAQFTPVDRSFEVKKLLTNELKPYHVQKWIDSKECSDGHKRGCITAVKRAMSWAEKMGYIDRNPIARMEKPSPGRRDVVIREPEFHKLLAHYQHDDDFRDLLVTAWETGARPQELLRVETRHIELKKSRWVFPKEEAKGKRKTRVVYLTDKALEITKRRSEQWSDGPIFRNMITTPWKRNAVNCRFRRLEKHIGKRLCLYHFRHSFATRMIESGVDTLVVAALMGHSDLSMLGRTYAHLTQNSEHLLKHLQQNAR